MKYEVVNLEEKIIVGLSAVTSNNSPDMGKVIGNLWRNFYEGGISQSVKNKVNSFAIGLYSDYLGENYTITVGNEVTEPKNDELTIKVIPSGKYAKFSTNGNMVDAVAEVWDEIWNMSLDRSFTGDFEEYLNNDFENSDIDIYIALN